MEEAKEVGTPPPSNLLTVEQVLDAGRRALRSLLEAGQDRVVSRDGKVQVLRPGDEGYWKNTGFDMPGYEEITENS